MIKSNFKSRFPWLVFGIFLFFFPFARDGQALLQGNRVVLIEDCENQEAGVPSCLVKGETAFGRAGTSLALPYLVTASGSSAYFSTRVADLTGMRYLSFWMKPEGDRMRLEFFVELREDTDGDGSYTAGKDTVDRIPASGFSRTIEKEGWSKVTVPLSRFKKIQRLERVAEAAFVFENKKRLRKKRVLLDNILFGSNYPEDFQGKEISMQNRLGSFRIGNQRISGSEMKLKRKPTSLTLTLTFSDPYLEEIRFEKSRDRGRLWERIHSFYDQTNGGVYKCNWNPSRDRKRKGAVLLRAIGVNLFGGEVELVGPYQLDFN